MSIKKGIFHRWVIIFLFVIILFPIDVFAAIPAGVEEDAVRRAYSGIHFVVDVQKPFPNSPMHFFPNGKDTIQVNLEAIRSDGTFSENQPLIIEKPDFLQVSGPSCTQSGAIPLYFSSTKSGTARVRIKLANYPQINTTFNLNFRSVLTISNRTDTSSFVLKQPITFIAQIDPIEARGLKEAKLRYVSTGNFFGIKTSKKEIIKHLKCSSDGICSATIPASQTNLILLRRRTFNYKFSFVDQQNNKFQQSFTGSLNLP